MPNNLLHVEPLGFNLIPPDTTQRLWVPREAVTSVQVLGVVGLKAAAGKADEDSARRADAPVRFLTYTPRVSRRPSTSGRPASRIFRTVDRMS
jgi:hypothetical protein